MTDYEHETFSTHENVQELSEAMRNSRGPNADDKKVVVWEGFGSQISDELVEKSDWQLGFVKLLGDEERWQWKYRFSGDKADRSGNQELIDALASPSRGLLASLHFRKFESEDSFEGSLKWLEEFTSNIDKEHNEYWIIIDTIIQQLRDAEKVGLQLLLEQISIIDSPDPETPMTVTPHLHRDVDYGHLEAAIVSFYSKDTTPNSSTLFFPDFDFSASSHLKPITSDKLRDNFPDSSAYSIASGSLAIFSGKISSDGTRSDERGALHVSPEGFFPTKRLLFMFRASYGKPGEERKL